MNELSKIFGSAERLRLMRFMLRDENKEYTLSDLADKTKIKNDILKKELQMLLSIEMISKYKSKVYAFQKGASVLKEATVFRLNPKFKYRDNLSALVLDYKSVDRSLLLSRLKGLSRVKLLLLAGVFIGDDKSRVDVLYVGEGIKLKELEKAFAAISVELGRDIKYVIMDVEEFVYRQKMFDAFVVDVVNGQNEVLVDKLNKY